LRALQEAVARWMERLAAEHPHHTLHHLMALKKGNRGKDGIAVDPAAAENLQEAMVHSVDFDKLWAADMVLRQLCARQPHM
jgi:hypothetical protein